MTIDDQMRIWQKGEPPLDILKTPYQNLKFLSMQVAARARTRAEWMRDTGNMMSKECREIDREISQISIKLNQEEKGIVRTKMMGSNMDKSTVASFNQDVNKTCPYCMDGDGSWDHMCWTCKPLQSKREELDSGVARIPVRCLPLNVRSGIAPAMRTDGYASYWGGPLNEEVEQRTQILLGKDTQLHKPGNDRDETDARKEALDILDEPENRYSNMRQIIMEYKKTHGSGNMLAYPDKQDIQQHMQGCDDNRYVNIYGDGSQTDPTN